MARIVDVPGSKSMTQRALVIAALADAPVTIQGALICDDSRYLTDALRALGVGVEWDKSGARPVVTVMPPAALTSDGRPLFCGNAGTAVRFLAALSLLVDGPMTIDGDERMRQRPIAPLVDALGHLGVQGRYRHDPGAPPIELEREGITPNAAHISASPSSQFASGVMMVAPRLSSGLTLTLDGPIVSRPYLEMTTSMMASARGNVEWSDDRTVRIWPGAYHLDAPIVIEPDWSGAAFILAAGFITDREVSVPGLVEPGHSLQGDAVFGKWLQELREAPDGADHYSFDLTHAPDLLPPLAAAALFARAPVRIKGAEHTRVKECDRLAVLARELARVGAHIREHPDGLHIEPLDVDAANQAVELEPENDHRMAMTFGLLRLQLPELGIKNPDCVSKSFPGFWDALGLLTK